jgi:hypothetical protein
MAENARHFPRMFRRTRLSLGSARSAVLVGAALASACASRGATAEPPVAVSAPSVHSARAALQVTPSPTLVEADSTAPRLFPPLDGSETLAAGEERDGSQRLVAYGLRVLSRPDGALELSREYLPAARTVQSLELPSRLGGGFLFYVLSSSATLFFRAKTFTAALEPFARLDFEADQVMAGFDRLYVLGRRPDRFAALDADGGAALGLGSLPPSPGFGKMAFVDAWFGAVQAPFRGILVTFDAGASWHPLGTTATNIEVRDGELLLSGSEGVLGLDHNGAFSRRDSASAAASDGDNPIAQRLRQAVAGPDPRSTHEPLAQGALKSAVLRGFRDADGSFIVANAGALLRVRADDGKVIAHDEHAYPGGGECTALPFGRGFGFACSDGADQSTLFAFEPPLAMRRVRSFAGARYVASSGNGALVIRGSCGVRSEPATGAYCIAESSGNFREIRVRGDLGVERVVALGDGRVAVIVPPRLGAPGFLSLIDARGREQRVPLKLPPGEQQVAPTDEAHAGANALLESGLWLDGFRELPNGALAGWVAGAEPFAGVRVALDGTVTVSRPEASIDRALLSGTHALVVGHTGRAVESTDGGFEWSDVDLPAEFDAGREPRDDARLQGCSELGCAFAGFVRVGWKTGSAAPRLPVARLPDPTPMIQPGGGRWSLHCEPTGEGSEPALALPARPRGPSRGEDSSVAPWAPFLELGAPALASGEVGFDSAGSESDSVELHAYAWGERSADWGRAGHAQIRALDRFQVTRGVFQSAVTRGPWADATAAAEAFGFDGTGNPTNWRALLETGQRSGALVVSSRGLVDLLLFEEGRSITRIPNVARQGMGMLTSVTKLGDAWYASAFNENHAFTLSRIVGNRIERLAEYPDITREPMGAALVRGVRGDALGIWVVARGWYLFPVDPETGNAGAPLYESPADLATMPPLCPADADGFLLSGAPTLEPNISFSKADESLTARHVEAQFVWSARGMCIRSLAADSEGAAKHLATSAAHGVDAKPSPKVPLTVSERRPEGRRWGFTCSP